MPGVGGELCKKNEVHPSRLVQEHHAMQRRSTQIFIFCDHAVPQQFRCGKRTPPHCESHIPVDLRASTETLFRLLGCRAKEGCFTGHWSPLSVRVYENPHLGDKLSIGLTPLPSTPLLSTQLTWHPHKTEGIGPQPPVVSSAPLGTLVDVAAA